MKQKILSLTIFLLGVCSCKKETVIPVPDNLFIYDEENQDFYITGQCKVPDVDNSLIYYDNLTEKVFSFYQEGGNNNYTVTLREYLGYGQWAEEPFFKHCYQLTEENKPLMFVSLCGDRFLWCYTESYTYIRYLEKRL